MTSWHKITPNKVDIPLKSINVTWALLLRYEWDVTQRERFDPSARPQDVYRLFRTIGVVYLATKSYNSISWP